MASSSARPGASAKKKPRHTPAQKKAARQAREQARRSSGDSGSKPPKKSHRKGQSPARPATGEHREQHSVRARREEREGRPTREHSAPRAPKERPAATAAAAQPETSQGFADFGLDDRLVQALTAQGITTPFPIQDATIPDALAGRDLLGRGQTGSGKTLAFGLPALHRLAQGERARPHQPKAIIMTPTRELAMQIVDALGPLMSTLRLRHQLIAGGMPYQPQLRSLERGVDVLVATPGRLTDLINRGAADLSSVQITVLDEADHMAEMGFLEAITAILDLTPTAGQRLLFSATLDHGVDRLAQRYLHDPVTHSTHDATASVDTMEHRLFLVHPHHKKPVTAAIANRSGRTVVFCRTKLGTDRVATQLRESGVFAAPLHGGLNQTQRTRVLEAFKSGDLPVLVATDVAARGIHVDDVSLVLQVDPPADHKDYLHRSGRTARAGEDGVVVTLALPHQQRQVTRMLGSAGVQTTALTVGPEDTAVIETAGGRVPDGAAVPQSRLDAVLRPPRGRGGSRNGGGYRGGRPRSGGGGQRSGGGGQRGARAGGGSQRRGERG